MVLDVIRDEWCTKCICIIKKYASVFSFPLLLSQKGRNSHYLINMAEIIMISPQGWQRCHHISLNVYTLLQTPVHLKIIITVLKITINLLKSFFLKGFVTHFI